MTDQRSPWALPETEVVLSGAVQASTPTPPQRVATLPAAKGLAPGYRPGPGPAAPGYRPGAGPAAPGYRPGAVTALNTPGGGQAGPPPDVIHGGPDDHEDPARRNRMILRWFIGGAAAIIAVGLVVVLGMVMTGHSGASPFNREKGPSDVIPPLAKRCPPPSNPPERQPGVVPSTPPGARTVDSAAGISYQAYGAPWEPWSQVWTAGELHVSYKVGQHFVTEHYGFDDYHASILSASVPATVNDALVLDLKCTGQQVAADVRAKYYPQPNTVEMMRDEQAELGGRQAWVTKFRLHFRAPGLTAKDELVGIALIDVGRPEAAILYVSIPGTHKQFDPVVDEVLNSVRPL